MKKKLFIVVLGLFLFIPILNVKADTIELTQAMFDAAKNNEAGAPDYISYESHDYTINADNGSYDFILGENINLGEDINFINGTYNLNLNGKLLNCRSFYANTVNMVISGNGTVSGHAGFDYSNVTIMNGTFNNYISGWGTKLIIEDATVYSDETEYAIDVNSNSEFEFRGGTYTVSEVGNSKDNSAAVRVKHSEAKIVVKGGHFSGGKYGIYTETSEAEGIKLLGGTFEGTEAAINILGFGLSNYTNDKTLETLLAEGYMYSPSMTIVNEASTNGYNYNSYTKEKTLEVVKKPEEPVSEETSSEEVKTKNPKTSDSIINYVLITILCITSLIIIKKAQ